MEIIKDPVPNQADGPLDLRWLAVFLAVAQTGSMTEAGRRFGLSQPSVSQTMTRLEGRLGGSLFEREARPLVLTAVGEVLRDGAEALLRAESELRHSVRTSVETETSSVRLGLIDSFAATVGPALIRTVRGYVEKISVWSGISPSLWTDLQDRRLDFMVSSEPMTLAPGAKRWKLMTEPFVLLLPKRLAANIRAPSLVELAANHPFVRYSMRSHIGVQIESALKARDVAPRPSMEFDGTEAVFAMVGAGLGWAITTPLCLVHGRAHAEELTAMAVPGKAFSRTLYLISGPGGDGAAGERIAEDARHILRAMIDAEIRALVPWATDGVVVHSP